MSTSDLSATRGETGGQSSGKSRTSSGVKPASGRSYNARSRPSGKSSDQSIWGKSPKWARDQQGITELLERQKQLKAALSRQSRLASLAVDEVCSTEAEHLRRVNSQLAEWISPGSTTQGVFARNPTAQQLLAEKMVASQGVRTLDSKNPPPVQPRNRTPTLRRRPVAVSEKHIMPIRHSPRELGTLLGPLLRTFSRAKARGYQGPPNRWLGGLTAAKEILRLRQRNLLDPRWTGELSVFNRYSPLRWAVNGCSATEATVRHGFRDERLDYEGTEVCTLVGQARAVQRLPKKKWPRDPKTRGYAWPTYPTLFESWECMMRRKTPTLHADTCDRRYFSEHKTPTRQVKPGALERTIRLHVRGVRADLAVPGKYLAYFRYRWGFLILRRDCLLPRDLARWLANLWKSGNTKIFLVYPIRYNEALRRLPDVKRLFLSGFVAAAPPKREKQRPPRIHIREKVRSETFSDSGTSTSNRSFRGVRLS